MMGIKRVEIDAQIAKEGVTNLKSFNQAYSTRLKDVITSSQNNINRSVNDFVTNSLNSSTSTRSLIFNINKTLEQDVRETQELISSNKNANSLIDSNLSPKPGISAYDSGYFYTYSTILANTKFNGNATEAYENASRFYSETLRLLNSSVASEYVSQAKLDEFRERITDRISSLAESYQDINGVVLESVRTRYETEVARTNTDLELQRTLLEAERELEQNNIEIKQLEAQANLYPEIYKNSMGNILYTTITAPYDGVVTDLPVLRGKFVNASDLVASVQGNNGTKSAIVEVDKYLNVKPRDEVIVYDPEKPFQKLKAVVVGVGGAVNKNGLKVVQIQLPKNANINSNQTIRMRLKKDTNLEVPLSSVSVVEDKSYVWKVVDSKLFRTSVVLGTIVDNKVKVESGLSEGEVIAARVSSDYQEGMSIEIKSTGASGQPVNEDGHAHEH